MSYAESQIRQARVRAIQSVSATFAKVGIRLLSGAASRIAQGRRLTPTQHYATRYAAKIS